MYRLPTRAAHPGRCGRYGGCAAGSPARGTELGGIGAVKVLPPGRIQDASSVARFLREMQAVGQLNHPNIVQAADAREMEGVHFLVMEYVEGTNLADLV